MLTFLDNIQLNFKQRGDLAGFLIAAGYQLPSVVVDELAKPEWDKPARTMFICYHRFKGMTVAVLEENIKGLNDGLTLLAANPFGTEYPRMILNDKIVQCIDAINVLKQVNDFIEKHNLQKE